MADNPTLSVVMPVYNEQNALAAVIDRIRAVEIPHELIVVDDGSSDGTAHLLDGLAQLPRVRILRHAANRGKGAALRTGFASAVGEIVIIQDADLEYDPADYLQIIEPIISGRADVVYGSRFLHGASAEMPRTRHLANRLISWLFSRATRLPLTDVETCYKAFRLETLRQVLPQLSEDRFGIEIELTARLARLPGVRITEAPIRYQARGRRDGKKIRFRDGLRALWCIAKYCRRTT
jgi:glycosyltransferase involved in cell wall biosynthesis